jgi:hypothetical protein
VSGLRRMQCLIFPGTTLGMTKWMMRFMSRKTFRRYIARFNSFIQKNKLGWVSLVFLATPLCGSWLLGYHSKRDVLGAPVL